MENEEENDVESDSDNAQTPRSSSESFSSDAVNETISLMEKCFNHNCCNCKASGICFNCKAIGKCEEMDKRLDEVYSTIPRSGLYLMDFDDCSRAIDVLNRVRGQNRSLLKKVCVCMSMVNKGNVNLSDLIQQVENSTNVHDIVDKFVKSMDVCNIPQPEEYEVPDSNTVSDSERNRIYVCEQDDADDTCPEKVGEANMNHDKFDVKTTPVCNSEDQPNNTTFNVSIVETQFDVKTTPVCNSEDQPNNTTFNVSIVEMQSQKSTCTSLETPKPSVTYPCIQETPKVGGASDMEQLVGVEITPYLLPSNCAPVSQHSSSKRCYTLRNTTLIRPPYRLSTYRPSKGSTKEKEEQERLKKLEKSWRRSQV